MKQKIVDAFENVTMGSDCEQRIRKAMSENHSRRKNTVLKHLAAVAAVFALILCLSPEARAAVENMVVKYIFPESGITIYEETDDQGNVTGIMAVDTGAAPFAEVRGDRLYFLGNGEELDITDQISEEEPFLYSYMDDYGLTHYMAVGCSGSIENFGIYEFIRENKEGQQDWEGWVNGTGRNFLDPETDVRYPWVDIVWEQLDIPWPLPGE